MLLGVQGVAGCCGVVEDVVMCCRCLTWCGLVLRGVVGALGVMGVTGETGFSGVAGISGVAGCCRVSQGVVLYCRVLGSVVGCCGCCRSCGIYWVLLIVAEYSGVLRMLEMLRVYWILWGICAEFRRCSGYCEGLRGVA